MQVRNYIQVMHVIKVMQVMLVMNVVVSKAKQADKTVQVLNVIVMQVK